MGTIIEFPADAPRRRPQAPREGMAVVLILPSIRIERHEEAGEPGPAQGVRGGRRRARS